MSRQCTDEVDPCSEAETFSVEETLTTAVSSNNTASSGNTSTRKVILWFHKKKTNNSHCIETYKLYRFGPESNVSIKWLEWVGISVQDLEGQNDRAVEEKRKVVVIASTAGPAKIQRILEGNLLPW